MRESNNDGAWAKQVAKAAGLQLELVRRHSEAIKTGVKAFEPYCLRHTALRRLAEAGCDAFTLARIAGHSSITITQRYCHPQAEAVERAFAKLGGHNFGHSEQKVLPELKTVSSVTNTA
jgi:integrase